MDGSQPGTQHFDFRSNSFTGVTDEIIIDSDSAKYCMSCVINIAVFGFRSGMYSIVAQSKGSAELQSDVAVGGNVKVGKYKYYSFRNTDPTSVISITLTTISGDPDLFVNAFKRKDNAVMKLPTKSQSDWHSYRAGADSVTIKYSDDKFCFDCEYIIGVYGYKNASYTILASSKTAAVVQLVRNRPQISGGNTGDLKYFRVNFGSSVEDITVSLTGLDTGTSITYVRVANVSGSTDNTDYFPKPDDPQTYVQSTAGSLEQVLYIHNSYFEGAAVLICVQITSTIHFSIVATSSQDVILLNEGTPQNHYVARGTTVFFRFPIQEPGDIQISLTARSGDPDLIVSSTNERPYCTTNDLEWWSVQCYNQTWSSRVFSTDQIIISQDFPCKPFLASTKIDKSCDPLNMPMKSLYIGVFGFQSAKFIIMATILGKRIQLLPGRPQPAATTKGFVCSPRVDDTGACVTKNSKYSAQMQVSYFSFQVAAESIQDKKSSIMIDVVPNCNTNYTGTPNNKECTPGCDCSPLVISLLSCAVEACKSSDMFPSTVDEQHNMLRAVDASGSTLFVALDPLYNENLCYPSMSPSGCMYYVSVISNQVDKSVTFTITARTSKDVSLVPCESKNSPDGIRSAIRDVVSTQSGIARLYEVCSDSSRAGSQELVISVEQCYGDMSMYVCADDNKCQSLLPTVTNWMYYADIYKTCRMKNSGVSDCTSSSPSLTNQKIALNLPKTAKNYFLMINGSGEYSLQVQSVGTNDQLSAPALVRPGKPEVNSAIEVESSLQAISISFRPTLVLLPGLASPLAAANMQYTIYVIDMDKLQSLTSAALGGSQTEYLLRPQTPCGLNYMAEHYRAAVQVTVLPNQQDSTELIRYTFSNLINGKSYKFGVLATCDSTCLRLLSKVTKAATITCAGQFSCKPQQSAYLLSEAMKYVGPNSDSRTNNANENTSVGIRVLIGFSVVTILFVLGGLGTLFRMYVKSQDPEADSTTYELTDTRFFSTSGTEEREKNVPDLEESKEKAAKWPAMGFGSGQTPYAPLITSTEGEGEGEGGGQEAML